MEISKSEKLSAKIRLWEHINSYINKTEETYPIFFSLLVTIIGVVIALLNSTFAETNFYEVKVALLFFLPICLAAVIAYLSYNFRWVAIARMYLTALEKEINQDLESNIYVWNSDIINKFMAHDNFTNTKLLPFINASVFVFVSVYLNYSMFATELGLFIKIIYLLYTISLFITCLCPFTGNEKIRTRKYIFSEK